MATWGKAEVVQHIQKVREFYGHDKYTVLTGETLLKLLEEYDKQHPITQEQADVVQDYVIRALQVVARRQNN